MNVVNSLVYVRMETVSMLPEASHVSAFQDLDRLSIAMVALVRTINFDNFKETGLFYLFDFVSLTQQLMVGSVFEFHQLTEIYL